MVCSRHDTTQTRLTSRTNQHKPKYPHYEVESNSTNPRRRWATAVKKINTNGEPKKRRASSVHSG